MSILSRFFGQPTKELDTELAQEKLRLAEEEKKKRAEHNERYACATYCELCRKELVEHTDTLAYDICTGEVTKSKTYKRCIDWKKLQDLPPLMSYRARWDNGHTSINKEYSKYW